MRALLRLMRPDSFEDISAVGALYRPGPMGADSHTNYALRKNGREEIDADPPRAGRAARAEILGETYGLIVYQEQVHGDRPEARRLLARPGRPAAPGDGQEEEGGPRRRVRRLRGRHAERTATPRRAIKALWDILVPFSDYAFNKAHSAAYGLVSYWTAYLKANYPAEYMAALLTVGQGRQGQVGDLPQRVPPDGASRCCRPTSTSPTANFTPVGTDIRFGLTAIRNVGANVVDGIVAARAGEGPLHRLQRLPRQGRRPLVCNKRVIESLVKAGAFDDLEHTPPGAGRGPRAGGRRSTSTIKRNEAIGQDSLFGGLDDDATPASAMAIAVPEIDEWDKQTLLGHEREMLGLYVSDHPLFGLEHVLAGAQRLHASAS